MNQKYYKIISNPKNAFDWKILSLVFCIFIFSTPMTFAQTNLIDKEPPILLIPSDIYVISSLPTPVFFTVKALDNVNGQVSVNCDKISGQVFKVGKTVVRCEAYDNARNGSQSSFVVTVGYEIVQIPSWVKITTKFWANNSIDDKTYSETIRYLINEKIVKVPTARISDYYPVDIPIWIKTNAQYWVDGKISDDEYSIMLQWMINRGLIKS